MTVAVAVVVTEFSRDIDSDRIGRKAGWWSFPWLGISKGTRTLCVVLLWKYLLLLVRQGVVQSTFIYTVTSLSPL